MTFQEKKPSNSFYSHTVWFLNFPNCLKPELQDHIAKNIKFANLSLISNKAPNLSFGICSKINAVLNTNLILL